MASACGGGSNSATPALTIESDAPATNLEQDQPASTTSTVADAPSTTSTTAPEATIESDAPATNLEQDQPASTTSTVADAPSTTSTTAPEATTSLATSIEPATETMAPESIPSSNDDDGPSANQPANPFTSTDPDLRACLIAALGQQSYDELATRQPLPEEQQAMGPCMGPAQDDMGPTQDNMGPADTNPARPDNDNGPSANQPANPFTSTDPDLRACLIAALGQQSYDELATRQPLPEEQQAIGPCMGPAQGGAGPSDAAASEGPGGPEPGTESVQPTYPPHLTAPLLLGDSAAPTGFDDCMIAQIGGERLGELRSKQPPSGSENDLAALCLLQLQVSPELLEGSDRPFEPVGPTDPNSNQDQSTETITVTYPSTSYSVAPGGTSGFFTTAQNADITLSAVGFNDTGGPLRFNRPSGLTTDGARLVMTDVFNNRVLIWNTAPTHTNQEPDLVLGQPNFTTNEPGTGRNQLNWPMSASTDGTRLAVTDTNNHRILIWTEFPTSNAEPADIILSGGTNANPSKSNIRWPWGGVDRRDQGRCRQYRKRKRSDMEQLPHLRWPAGRPTADRIRPHRNPEADLQRRKLADRGRPQRHRGRWQRGRDLLLDQFPNDRSTAV